MNGRVLIIDDDPDMCRFLESELVDRGFSASSCTSANQGLRSLKAGGFDLVLSDVQMPQMNGLELCKRIVAQDENLPVVVVTAHANLPNAVAALRAGAFDFIAKPVDTELLGRTVHRALERRRAAATPARDMDKVDVELIGSSGVMNDLRSELARMSGADCPVLIRGESGTGKDVVARWLHQRSHRRAGPFVAVNCAAIPHALLESELFGHVRGAFTDARSDRRGLFEEADGGTIFLDEIGEMPLEMQPKLLRALDQRVVRPLGGARTVPFDARIIAATNADLEEMVAAGRFRADLYYRIDVLSVMLPPLRARGQDVLRFAEHFVEHFGTREGKTLTIDPDAADRLLAYEWPGNIRELCNCIERAVILTKDGRVRVTDLPRRVVDSTPSHASGAAGEPLRLCEVEKRHILRVLHSTGGNKARAARMLGVDRKTLARKLEQYGASGGGDPR